MKTHTPKQKKDFFQGIGTDLIGVSLLVLFLFLFLNRDFLKQKENFFSIPESFLSVNTIFLSIVLEALPFILLGVFVSGLIQIFIKEDMIQRYLPKNAFAALLPATLIAALLPICECAIIPVVRRLIKKGMPLHVGVVFLVAAPILNPVVFASTYFAFRSNLSVVYSRMGIAFILAMVVGAILYLIFRNSNQIKDAAPSHSHTHHHSHNHTHSPSHDHSSHQEKRTKIRKVLNQLKQTLYHATDEFFDMGKYLIAGAFIAALFQTYLDRQILLSIGSDEYSSSIVMMAFAYVLSLCSEADAFVAASFGGTFTTGSLVAFLVYGPMIDLKNTIMYFAYFKTRFVLVFILTVTVTVFLSIMLLQWLFLS